MIFWNEYHTPRIIENKDISILAKEYDVELLTENDIDNENIRDWFNFALISSRKHDFNIMYESCFIYYVTFFMADEGISVGTEEKYFMKKLDTVIMDLYLSIPVHIDEVHRKRLFYNRLTDFFKSGVAKQYERRLFQHNIRVNNEIKEWFDNQSNVRETIRGLMDGSIEHPHLNANIKGNNNIVFLLTYSEELQWKGLSFLDDPDRLRVLLY